MRKFIVLIICGVFLSSCYPSNQAQRNVKDNPVSVQTNSATAIIIQKLDKDTAFVGYPASKTDYGIAKHEKLYYVKDKILRNFADDDEIIGYKVEKILNKTYSYTTLGGHPRTLSCGKLVKIIKKPSIVKPSTETPSKEFLPIDD